MASIRQAFCSSSDCPLEFVKIDENTPSWMVMLAFMTRNHQRYEKGSPFTVEQIRSVCKEIGLMGTRAYNEMYKIFDDFAERGEVVDKMERDETLTVMKQLMTPFAERSSESSSKNVTVESVSNDFNGMSIQHNEGRRNGDIYPHEHREPREQAWRGAPRDIPPSVSVSASSERTDSMEKAYGGPQRVDFSNFVDKLNPFLSMTKTEAPVSEAALKTVKGPLGVCYDPYLDIWAVADQKNNRVYMLPTEQCIFEDNLLIQPSAVCVVKPGKSMAILCENTILLYLHINNDVEIIYQQNSKHGFRGIAATPAGNLITISKQSLYIFDTSGNSEAPLHCFSFSSTRCNASFLDVFNTKVVVTDLGSQSVYLCHLDDTKPVPEFQLIKTHRQFWPPQDKEPNGGFRFVSGVHIDAQGKILIADADGHCYSLFDENLTFLHRVAADFVAPYTSGFTVSPGGMVLIADRKANCLVFCRLTSNENISEHLPFGGGGYGGGGRGFALGRGRGGFRGNSNRGGRGGY